MMQVKLNPFVKNVIPCHSQSRIRLAMSKLSMKVCNAALNNTQHNNNAIQSRSSDRLFHCLFIVLKIPLFSMLIGDTLLWYFMQSLGFINLMNKHFPNLLADNENYSFTMDYIIRLNFKLMFLCVLRGRLHGAFSTPGLNSALLTGLKFFAITWTISTPGSKRYTIRSRHRFAEVKKAFILFSCNK